MPEFRAPLTIGEVHFLDHMTLRAGYHAAQCGEPEPIASYFSRDFWYGWHLGHSEMLEAADKPATLLCEYVSAQLRHLQARPQ